MAIQTRNKRRAEFSMASMSDLVFLLLIFFMLTSTLVAPNAIKLLLPQSNSKTLAKQTITVYINEDYRLNENNPDDLVCVKMLHSMNLRSNMDVCLCPKDIRRVTRIGNLKKKRLLQIMQSPDYRRLLAMSKRGRLIEMEPCRSLCVSSSFKN